MGFEPMAYDFCDVSATELHEATQLEGGQFVGHMFFREGLDE